MKLAEKDIPRISNQILQIYNNWSSKKQILLAINNERFNILYERK